ncbi:hypothetical protein P7C71_g6576, partial [Lecanoromycetidae sp. Uapishka_2]
KVQMIGSNTIPDFDNEFITKADIEEFAKALSAPAYTPVIALNDWRPIHQRVKRKKPRARKKPRRTTDETREGYVYTLLKWPLLLIVFGWIVFLSTSYLLTRTYIWGYERLVTWRGQRQKLRRNLRSKTDYDEWRAAAQELDTHLGNEQWKEADDYAYYDFTTVTKVKNQLKAGRALAESHEHSKGRSSKEAIHELRSLVEACVKNNFVGVENSRLYSETYYGTKHLAQEFVDELHASLAYLLHSTQLSKSEKYSLAKHLHTNFGRTALCLSGGATFAYYHFGVVKALLDASLLPDVITGTSGGAIVAALASTRTDEELQKLLVPALAHHIKACEETFLTWAPRWWRTGASLRTDIPLKALNLHFGVNFSIVSQVNPHINLFFFSSRGAVGRPVTHRRGRGWRGGYLGSATETYLKLELQKFIKISKHLELLPRPLGQDWSGIWLQQFSGTITIWPKSRISDFWYILSDPSPERLARMLVAGQQSTFPKLLFVQNRMKIERLIEEGLLLEGSGHADVEGVATRDRESMHIHGQAMRSSAEPSTEDEMENRRLGKEDRRSSVIQELKRQSGVFFDDFG